MKLLVSQANPFATGGWVWYGAVFLYTHAHTHLIHPKYFTFNFTCYFHDHKGPFSRCDRLAQFWRPSEM